MTDFAALEEEAKKGVTIVKCLAVDHCHQTGKVRGLLCSRCNTAIGMLACPTIVQAAAAYVAKHKEEGS